MEPAGPAGGAAGLRRRAPSARACGGAEASGAVPRSAGRRAAPGRQAHAVPCQPTGWRRFSPLSAPREGGRELGELTPRSPPAKVRCPSARSRCCGGDARPAETTMPGVQRAQRRSPCAGAQPGRLRGPGLAERGCSPCLPPVALRRRLSALHPPSAGRLACGARLGSQRFPSVTHKGL